MARLPQPTTTRHDASTQQKRGNVASGKYIQKAALRPSLLDSPWVMLRQLRGTLSGIWQVLRDQGTLRNSSPGFGTG